MNQPNYYTDGRLSPVDVFRDGFLTHDEYIGFLKGNVYKYVHRVGRKDGASVKSDLDKARTYINFLEEALSENSYLDCRIDVNDFEEFNEDILKDSIRNWK